LGYWWKSAWLKNVENIKDFLKTLPADPGIYRMIDNQENVIYVGKAKNIKKRVLSYFNKNIPSPRTRLMVSHINSIEYTVTNTEAEALILENNVIKELMPRYNVIFRDDKSYPYLMMTNHKYPMLKFHRGAQKKGSKYFGPFPNSNAVRESIQLLQKVFLLRNCEDSVFTNRTRPCLQHQIKRCTAPCVKLISEKEYSQDCRQAELFLKGKDNEVIQQMTLSMNQAAEKEDFEKAAVFRDRVQSLRQVRLKQFVSDFSENDADIIAFAEEGGLVCVNLVMIRGGRHLGDKTFYPKNHGDNNLNIIEIFLCQHYSTHEPSPVIVAEGIFDLKLIKSFFEIKFPKQKIKIISKALGDKKMWLKMAKRNAMINVRQQNLLQTGKSDKLDSLRKLLNISDLNRIECFDISHTMGNQTVASCVVFDDLTMQNKEYRRFNIKDITPGDDYAAMKQVLERRIKRIISEDQIKPELMLIDGGKGQLKMALEVFDQLDVQGIRLLSIAKGEGRKSGLETLIFDDGEVISQISKNNLGFHLLQHIRDEAHRFAITGHRQKRQKVNLSSSIEEIDGIGPKKRKALLVYFGGLSGVQNASTEELLQVTGINQTLAEIVYNFYH
jgi:excinuclease ABC subunit C